MSGLGGGGSTGSSELNCGSISFNTELNSPQEDVISNLKSGGHLNIVLQGGILLAVLPDNNDIAGSINWSSISRLIECIENGYEYIATIRDIQGGLVRIHVHAKTEAI